MIDISIIITTYNSCKTLRKALESVMSQSFQNWECIIVDGASKDNTIEIVKEFENKDSRFRYISEPDNGIYDAFNKGWKMARGTWIYYLGSDDYIFSDGLKGLMEYQEKADVLYGDMTYETGIKRKTKKSISENQLIGNMPCHQSMIMKKSLIERLNGFDIHRFRLCADFDLFQRALRIGARVYHVSVIIACFNSMGSSSGIKTYMKECFIIKKEYNGKLFALNYFVKESLKRFIKKYMILILNK